MIKSVKLMEGSGDPAVLADLSPSSSTGSSTRTMALVGSTIVVLSAVEIGWWWLQRYRNLQYRRDHPNTVFLTPYRHRLTKWGQVVEVMLRVAWTLLVVAVFGVYVSLDVVVMRGAGSVLRCAQAYTASLWEKFRAKRASWNTVNSDEQQQTTDTSTFVLAPILRSKHIGASAAFATAEPATTNQRAQGDRHKRAKKGVTFEEHSNGQIRHKQVSFDPASASSFSVEDSRTPPPPHADPLAQQPLPQRAKVRMPQTPPLPRRGRHVHSMAHSNKENVGTTSRMHRASAPVERNSNAQAPATPQNLREPDILSTKVTRPVIPPYPGASPQLTESIRKRRANTTAASSNDFSPAVKRMYGRLRLPAAAASQPQQHPYHYTSLLVARQLKRRRDNDRIVWEAFNCVPTASKRAAPQAAGTAPEASSAAASTFPPPAAAAVQFGSSAEAASNSNAGDNGTTTHPPAQFAFGTATVNAPERTDGAAAVEPSSIQQGSAPPSWTGGTAAPTPPFQFGSVNQASHREEVPGGNGTVVMPSGGAAVNREQFATPASTVQVGSSLPTSEVTATPQQAPPSGATFQFAAAPTTARNETAAPSLNPTATFQGAASGGAAMLADNKAAPDAAAKASTTPQFGFGNGQNASSTAGPKFSVDPNPSMKPLAAPTANTAPTTWPSSAPAATPTAQSFQFGPGNPHQQPAANSFAPSTSFGSNTPNPVSFSTAAHAPASAAVSGGQAGKFSFGPASHGAASNAPFSFSSGAAQPGFGTGAAQPAFGTATKTQPGFVSAATQPAFGTAATQPAFGTVAAQPAFGSAAAQPGFGPVAAQSGFAAQPAGAAYPFASSATFGTIAPTLQLGATPAARPSSRNRANRPNRPPRRNR